MCYTLLPFEPGPGFGDQLQRFIALDGRPVTARSRVNSHVAQHKGATVYCYKIKRIKKVSKDSIEPKRENFHFSEANMSRTSSSTGMISTLLESGFQHVSFRVELNLLELEVLEIF